MNLISKKINLMGVPGFESIGYEQWYAQCQHGFENNLLKNVSYQGLKMRISTDTNIMFKTFETVEASDGSINAQGIEIVLEKEDDGQWRVIQERVLPDDETEFDQLLKKQLNRIKKGHLWKDSGRKLKIATLYYWALTLKFIQTKLFASH